MTLLPIILPKGFVPKVSINDKLVKGTLLAEKKGSLGEELVELSKDYKISPKDLTKSLKKNLGDHIEAGEVLAIKSGSFFGGSNKVLSGFSGTIAKIDEGQGSVIIKTSYGEESEQIFSPVEGKVEICNNEKIVIKTSLDAVVANDSLGQEAEGKIFYLKNATEVVFNQNSKGKVLLIKAIDKASIFKAIGLDVIGIITKELEDLDFVDLTDKKINIPIMVIKDEDFEKVAKRTDSHVFLNGKDKSLIFYE